MGTFLLPITMTTTRRGYAGGASGHGTRHEDTGDRQRDSKPTKAQLVSESVIEVGTHVHLSTLTSIEAVHTKAACSMGAVLWHQ